jgi:hypothetical protein
MRTPRRHALRVVIAGPVLAGCPVHGTAAPPGTALESERFAICHRLRDGEAFPRPEQWRAADLVILGGGISGLAAARLCRDHDVVVLEKELLPGGHAQSTMLGDIPCSVGTAYVGRGDAAGQLAAELGLPLLPVSSWDGTADRGAFTPDTWGDGLDELPYPVAVRERFAACRRDFLALAPDDERHDDTPLAALLAPYGENVRRWWDAYCPSNWGGSSADVAASLAIDTLHWWAGPDRSDGRVTWPGGVGALARRLTADVTAARPGAIVTGATVLSLSRAGAGVEVTYVDGERISGIRAKAATPPTASSTSAATAPCRASGSIPGARGDGSPIASSPTGSAGRRGMPGETSSPAMCRLPRTSARRCSTTTIAGRSPPSWPTTSAPLCRRTRSLPWRPISTAAATRSTARRRG